MDSHGIDDFGMLVPPQAPATPTSVDSLLDQEGRGSVEPEGRQEPEASEGQSSEPSTESPRQAVAAVQGDGNEVAGRDIIHAYYGVDFDEIARARKKKRAGRGIQDPVALQRLADRYVEPDGWDSAFQTLESYRVLLLWAAERDGGQLAAACRLGHELTLRRQDDSGLIVREELVDADLSLKPNELLVEKEPAVVILDCRDAAVESRRTVERGLVELSAQLPDYQSYLIIVIPSAHRDRFGNLFPGRVRELEKPDSIEVLEKHVGPQVSGVRDDAEVREKLESLWPPAVSRVAELVRERLGEGDDPVTVVRSALEDELVGHGETLREVIKAKQQDGNSEWLSLLLSAAVLEGSPPQHVTAASDVLLAKNKIDVAKETAPILRASPLARLGQLEDAGWFDVNRNGLRPSGIGGEILRHFWREHPDLRTPMKNWLVELPDKLRPLEQEQLEQLADRAAELAAEGGAKLALVLATEWSRTRAGRESNGRRTSTAALDASRRSIAVRLLTTVATDSVMGRPVRDQLWRWSRDGNADLQLLTAEVCSGIGAEFPRNALTRLKHLANSDNEDVRQAVLDALRQLGVDLGVSRFLRYLTEWFGDAPPRRLVTLASAVKEVLADQSVVVEFWVAREFWRRAIHLLPENLQLVLSGWLQAAAKLEPDERARMLEPVVKSTDGSLRAIAQLQYASMPRPGLFVNVSHFSDPAIAEVTQQLWTRLEEIDPLRAEE
jgi:hypothetical protein